MFLVIRAYLYVLFNLAIGIFRIFILPEYFTIGLPDCALTVGRSFGTLYKFRYIIHATIDLAAHGMQVNIAFINKINTEIIVLIACDPALAGPKTNRTLRPFTSVPVDDIDIMHMLFYNVIARKPGPIDPVAYHGFHFAPARFGFHI